MVSHKGSVLGLWTFLMYIHVASPQCVCAERELWSLLFLLKVNVLVTQSCLTLCDPMDCSLPGYSVHRILQARILEWVAISFSRGSSQPGIKPRSPWVLQEPWFPSKKLQADSLPPKPQLLLLYSKRLQTLVAKLSDTLLSS